MEAARERNSVLIELEALQNDLIARLDDLDHRVCQVLKQWTAVRQSEAAPSALDLAGIEAIHTPGSRPTE